MRKKDNRREFLGSMADDERMAFIQREKASVQLRHSEEMASLENAFQRGAPKVVVNCSFTHSMDCKELTSLAKQLALSYTAIRELCSPIQLHITSLHADNPGLHALKKIGFEKWLVHVHEESVWELFAMEQLVVLSPDADEDLDEVREDCIYVIGGLVDRVIKRNQSRGQAEEKGAPVVRKLPIKTMGPPGMYPVLNIDIVVGILHERLTRGPNSSWRDILLRCMPQRQHPGPSRQELRRERANMRKAGMTDEQIAAHQGATRSENHVLEEGSDDGEDSTAEAASKFPDLRQGTEVKVAGFGTAKIISLGRLPHGQHKGKYKVRYLDDGSMYHVTPEQIAQVL